MLIKNITINKENDLIKLKRYLWVYRIPFFKFVHFNVKTYDRNKEIENVFKALNIKNRKNRIAFIYDIACKQIDDYNENNMCGFINGRCYVQRLTNKGVNGCCRGCVYQSSEGCKTKNLTCKLFNCSEVRCRYKVIEFEDLIILKCLTFRQQLILKHDYFSSREEMINDLYYGSIIIFTTRIIYRWLFKTFIWKLK